MAIVKATYTKQRAGAKATIRYMQHRLGKDGERVSRTLFGSDGAMGRWQAYTLIDQAAKGSIFFRFVISPDPRTEDTNRDLFLREVTEKTMLQLEEHINKSTSWVAVEHADHAPHRHIHVLAVVQSKLYIQDFQILRQAATAACQEQRQERDLANERQNERGKGEEWERSY